MEILLVLLVVVALLLLLVLAGKGLSRALVGRQAARGAQTLGPSSPGDFEESAALMSPIEYKGFGVLRLTPTQLLFAGAGDPIVIDRQNIVSVDTVTEVNGDHSHKPALRVSTREATVVFAVVNASDWVGRVLSA